MPEKQNKMNECWSCQNKRTVSGNCHIKCANPDPDMTGNEHGKKNGWFYYPSCFDPVWKTKLCSNYDQKETG